ncbi:hypothetical protein EMCRGX_G015743 [Ephydatia muelleri]
MTIHISTPEFHITFKLNGRINLSLVRAITCPVIVFREQFWNSKIHGVGSKMTNSSVSSSNGTFQSFSELSCWEKALAEGENRTSPLFLDPLQVTLQTTLFIFGSALNCFAFFLVARFKALRRRDFVLALQVLMADLLDISCIPVMVAVLLKGPAAMNGPIGCSMLGFVVTLFDAIRYGAMFVLAFDRFSTVFFPFTYPAHANVTTIVLSTTLWLFGVVFSCIPAALDCYGLGPYAGDCSIYSDCSNCAVIRSLYDVILTLLGVVFPTIMYSMLFWKARKMNKPISTGSLAMPPLLDTTRNHRAALTFFLLFVTLCGCAVPIYVEFFLLPIKESHPAVYWGYAALSHAFLDTVVLLDPIIVMRNRDVTEKIQELWSSLKRYVKYYLALSR